MATHSSILAWRIPGTKEPGGLPSMGLHRVGHDWSNLAVYSDLFFPYSLHSVMMPSFPQGAKKLRFLKHQLNVLPTHRMTPSSPQWSNWFSLFKYLFSFRLPQSHHRGHQLISVATLSVSLSCLALLSCLYLHKTFDIVFRVNGDPWPCDTGALNHSPLGWAPPNTDVIHSCLQFLNDPLWTRWVLFNLSPEESDGGWRVRRGTAWRSQPLRKKCFFNLKLYFILDFKYCIITYSCFNIAVIFPDFNWIPQEDVACLSYSLEYPWPISYWETRTNKIKCKILSPAPARLSALPTCPALSDLLSLLLTL